MSCYFRLFTTFGTYLPVAGLVLFICAFGVAALFAFNCTTAVIALVVCVVAVGAFAQLVAANVTLVVVVVVCAVAQLVAADVTLVVVVVVCAVAQLVAANVTLVILGGFVGVSSNIALIATSTFVPVFGIVGLPIGAEAMYMHSIYTVFPYNLCVIHISGNIQAVVCSQGCIFCAQNDAALTGQSAVDGHIAQNGEGLVVGDGNTCSLVNDYGLAGQCTPAVAQSCGAGFDGHAPVGVHDKDHIGGDVLCMGAFGACHSVNGGVVVSVGLQSTAVHHDSACYGAGEGLAVQIQSNACGQNNGSKVCCAGMVSQQNDGFAVLSCFDRFIQRCVLLFADLSNCGQNFAASLATYGAGLGSVNGSGFPVVFAFGALDTTAVCTFVPVVGIVGFPFAAVSMVDRSQFKFLAGIGKGLLIVLYTCGVAYRAGSFTAGLGLSYNSAGTLQFVSLAFGAFCALAAGQSQSVSAFLGPCPFAGVGVTGCINCSTGCGLGVASLAVGIAGVACFDTACGLSVADFGIANVVVIINSNHGLSFVSCCAVGILVVNLTYGAVPVSFVAFCGTGSCLVLCNFTHGVSQLANHIAAGSMATAVCTGHNSGLAFCGTGSFDLGCGLLHIVSVSVHGDFGLGNGEYITSGALLTVGQTGGITGSCIAGHINDLVCRVLGCVDAQAFRSFGGYTTVGTLLTCGEAFNLTACSNRGDLYEILVVFCIGAKAGMAGLYVTTAQTLHAFGEALNLTGCFHCGDRFGFTGVVGGIFCDFGLCYGDNTTSVTLGTVGQTGCGTCSCVTCDSFQLVSGMFASVYIAANITNSVTIVGVSFTKPLTCGINERGCFGCAQSIGRHSSTVCIPHLYGIQQKLNIFNLLVITAILFCLIGLLDQSAIFILCCTLNFYNTAFITKYIHDVSRGGINITLSCINSSLDFNLCISQRTSSLIAKICIVKRGIVNLVINKSLTVPASYIINKDAYVINQGYKATLFNNQCAPGEKRHILRNRYITSVFNAQCHIVGNGQYIFGGIHLGTGNLQLKALHNNVAINFYLKGVGAFNVVFNYVTIGNIKHRLRTDKRNLRTLISADIPTKTCNDTNVTNF